MEESKGHRKVELKEIPGFRRCSPAREAFQEQGMGVCRREGFGNPWYGCCFGKAYPGTYTPLKKGNVRVEGLTGDVLLDFPKEVYYSLAET